MKDVLLLRLYALLLILAIGWVLLGAPIFPEEWHALPDRFVLIVHQLPHRMGGILTHWH